MQPFFSDGRGGVLIWTSNYYPLDHFQGGLVAEDFEQKVGDLESKHTAPNDFPHFSAH